MYFGLHEWTAAHTGGVVDARFIALVDTALESPLGQIAMVPMLAWIANSAPDKLKATYFAVMASFTNLALSAAQLGTKYLNQIFVVTREVKDAATGAVKVAADYSQLGDLLIATTVLGFVVPLLAIAFVKIDAVPERLKAPPRRTRSTQRLESSRSYLCDLRGRCGLPRPASARSAGSPPSSPPTSCRIAAALAALVVAAGVRARARAGPEARDRRRLRQRRPARCSTRALAGVRRDRGGDVGGDLARFYLMMTTGERVITDIRRAVFGHLLALAARVLRARRAPAR